MPNQWTIEVTSVCGRQDIGRKPRKASDGQAVFLLGDMGRSLSLWKQKTIECEEDTTTHATQHNGRTVTDISAHLGGAIQPPDAPFGGRPSVRLVIPRWWRCPSCLSLLRPRLNVI